MALLFSILMIIVGLGILIAGADWLVKGASAVARSLGIPALVVGLTVVSFGTSAPELTVNLYSAFTGATDLAIGNIIGSNIANILLILGITVLITPLRVQSSTVKWEIPLALVAAMLVYVMGRDVLLDGAAADVITRSDGIVLIGFFAVFLFYVFALTKSDKLAAPDEAQPEEKSMSLAYAIGLIVVGLAALIFGGRIFVDNAIILAQVIGLSEAVIGLTVVAIGTSLPELATSVVAAMKRQIDIAVGNIIGSNIFNIFWILGATAVIAPLPVSSGFGVDALVMVSATLALFFALFVGTRHHLDRWQGIVFIFAYVGYVTYLIAYS